MKNLKRIAPLVGAFVLAAGPAWAVTVANQSKQEQVLTVDRGEKQSDHKIAAGDAFQVECPDSCGLRTRSGPAGYGRMAQGSDKLVISSEGMLTYADGDLVTGSARETPAGKAQKGAVREK
ncbi:hypothetical protein [Methylobacterium oxalidis]|nr:hypothetical protein [Methylobacterium oxalidis]GJE35900.1 hypothetical protein LDDCCGHA_6121 [Methylobacterium oxalidis]